MEFDTAEDVDFQRITTESEFYIEPEMVINPEKDANKKQKIQDYFGYHKLMAKTRTERMLQAHQKYEKGWQNDLNRSIEVRSSFKGSVNKN